MADRDFRVIDAGMTARVEVQGFEVTGDLFNASHHFTHEGRDIEMRVPDVAVGEDLMPTAKSRGHAQFRGGLTDNPTLGTNSYEIAYLDCTIRLPDKISLPAEMLATSPKRPDLAGATLTHGLDAISVAYEGYIASAASYWKDVVRWITGSSSLDTPGGLPTREASVGMQFPSLISLPDRTRFWMPGAGLTLMRQTEVNSELWRRIGVVLAAGHQVPVWTQFLGQAFRYRQRWDSNSCVLCCAIACETVAKIVNALSPTMMDGTQNPHPARKKPVMATILSDWVDLTGVSDIDARTDEIRYLAKVRNDLMHSGGETLAPNFETAKELFSAATKFVKYAERTFYTKKGTVDPRLFPV